MEGGINLRCVTDVYLPCDITGVFSFFCLFFFILFGKYIHLFYLEHFVKCHFINDIRRQLQRRQAVIILGRILCLFLASV